MTTLTGRARIACSAAEDIEDGWYVNVGIGMPTLVPDHVPAGREVVFHSENGILGFGPKAAPGREDPWLINAGKEHVTLLAGSSFFHHADSFAIVRGGHLDLCVLGAFEVAENGDIANWTTSLKAVPAIGGAMDLAVGSQRLWVLMEHTTREGKPRLVRRCQYPLTAVGAVKRVYTNLAVLDVTPRGFRIRKMAEGVDLKTLQDQTDAELTLDE